jgi:O-antigen/teichoic acid export membrane protein
MSTNNQSTGKKLAKALAKSLGSRYIVYAVQMISMMVLARLFSPETFGIFAVLQVFALFFVLFSEMGLAPALINEKSISSKMRNGVFSLSWLIGVLLCLIFWSCAPLIANFYNNPDYTLLVIPIALSVIFNTICIVPLASLQKDTSFVRIARSDALAELFSLFCILIAMQYISPIWSLCIKPFAVSIVRALLLWLASGKTQTGRASFGKDIGQVKRLLSFSMYQFGFNFLNFFSRNLDNILVGKYFSSASLGIYDKAYQLMKYPLMLLTFAMSPAIQPVLTEIKNTPKEFERLHNKFVHYMSYLGLVVGLSTFLLADLIVKIILGDQWQAVAPLLKIFAITIPIQIVLSSSGGFFQAAGRADLLFKCGLFSAATNVLAIIIGIISRDLESLCWLLVCTFSINYIQAYYLMGKVMFNNKLSVLKAHFILLIGVPTLAFFVFIY